MFLISSAIVSAGVQLKDYTRNNEKYYSYDIEYSKGWQLIPTDLSSYFTFVGAYGESPVNSAEATNMHNDALRYTHFAEENKLIGANPKTEKFYGVNNREEYVSYMQKLESNKNDLVFSADWYYFDRPTKMIWLISAKQEEKAKLHQGWNLFVAPQNLDFGNCKIERAYMWNPETNKWENVPVEDLKDPDSIGLGFAVKVKNTCTLGKDETTPPELPA